MAKLFDLQLAEKLRAQDPVMTLDQRAAALNRAGFYTFTGRRWTADSLRIARRHAADPRPSRLTWIAGLYTPSSPPPSPATPSSHSRSSPRSTASNAASAATNAAGTRSFTTASRSA